MVANKLKKHSRATGGKEEKEEGGDDFIDVFPSNVSKKLEGD